MKLGIMQPYFMPYIGYFQLMNAVDRFVVYDDVNYINRGWINRNNLLIGGKSQLFTISLGKASQNKLINEIEIIDDFKKFMRTVEMNYRKAPYFDAVFALLGKIVSFPEKQVAKFIMNSFYMIADYLHMETEFMMSSSIEKDNGLHGQAKILEICKKLGADTYINSIGGVDLYDRQCFRDKGIELHFIKTQFSTYRQFGNDFVAGLSMIDVMMFNSVDEINEMLCRYELL